MSMYTHVPELSERKETLFSASENDRLLRREITDLIEIVVSRRKRKLKESKIKQQD